MIKIRIIILILIILVLFSSNLYAFEKHQVLHFSAGMVIYSIADYLEFDKPMRWVIIAGSSKELYDHFNDGYVDMEDIIYTIGGGITSNYLLRIEKQF